MKFYDKEIARICNQSEVCQRLIQLDGIGPLTATALISSIGDASVFKNGREMAAYLGLVPRQHSTGGKTRLLKISKRGDRYLRSLLIHGARSAITRSKNMPTKTRNWVNQVVERRGTNKAVVALANKNARIMWALMTRGEDLKITE